MTRMDWQISEEGVPLPPGNGGKETSRRQRVLWLVALLLVAVVASIAVLRWRVGDQEETLHADLTEAILQEEQARLFGLRDEASGLAIRDVPEGWLESYRRTFHEPDESQAVDVVLEAVEFNGERAIATVRLDHTHQLRAYEFEHGRWRRAPLPQTMWGQGAEVTESASGAEQRVFYYEPDTAFAADLVAKLPALQSLLVADGLLPPAQAIRIEPREFESALMEPLPNVTIRLNSPHLVLPSGPWSGESEVRLALAQSFVVNTLSYSPDEFRLSGTGQFFKAAQTVAAMGWALTAEEQQRVRDRWRELAAEDDKWRSPFFESMVNFRGDPIEFWQPSTLELSALLAADYLYQTEGPDVLAHLVREARNASSWDAIMQDVLGRYTAEVDEEIATYAREGLEAAQRLRERPPAVVEPSLPLHVERLQEQPDERDSYHAWLPGQEEPLQVEWQQTEVVAADGTDLMRNCITIYGPLTMDGDWLELGQQVVARRIVVEEINPPVIPEGQIAPPDTVAYLLQSKARTIQQPPLQTLLALRNDGTQVPLVDLSLFEQVLPFRFNEGGSPRFLFTQPSPLCGHVWLWMYDPLQGILRHWLAPSRLGHGQLRLIPRPEREDVALLFESRRLADDTAPYGVLMLNEGGKIEPSGELSNHHQILGWDGNSENFIGLVYTGDFPTVGLIDPETGQIGEESIQPNPRVMSLPFWSMEQRALYYLGSPPYPAGTLPDPLELSTYRLDLDTWEITKLFEEPREERSVYWPATTMGDRLFVLQGLTSEVAAGTTFVRLLQVDPSTPDAYIVIDETDSGRIDTEIDTCSDGSVLYTLHGEERLLRRWHPERGTTTLLTYEDDGVSVLACP